MTVEARVTQLRRWRWQIEVSDVSLGPHDPPEEDLRISWVLGGRRHARAKAWRLVAREERRIERRLNAIRFDVRRTP